MAMTAGEIDRALAPRSGDARAVNLRRVLVSSFERLAGAQEEYAELCRMLAPSADPEDLQAVERAVLVRHGAEGGGDIAARGVVATIGAFHRADLAAARDDNSRLGVSMQAKVEAAARAVQAFKAAEELLREAVR